MKLRRVREILAANPAGAQEIPRRRGEARRAPRERETSGKHRGYRSRGRAAKFRRCIVGEVAEWLKAAVC